MPGPASHIFIANAILKSLDPETQTDVLDLVSGENEQYFYMGSSGPDLWFFAPDYPIIEFMEVLFEYTSKIVLPIMDLYENTIAPVVEAIEDVTDEVDVVLDTATCESISNIQARTEHITELLSGSASSLIVHLFTKSVNTFDLMRAEAQKGNEEKEWFWFDILHSRRTGSFLNQMWNLSGDSKKKQAYVLGYATHVAADIAGHPYINQVVGGPGRSHNQRHHFVENVLDIWFFANHKSNAMDVTNSNLHLQLPHGQELEDDGILLSVMGGLAREKEDLTEIFSMVSSAMDSVFPEAERPNRLTDGITSASDIKLAYWFLLASFKVSTGSFIPKLKPPTDGIIDAINDAMQEFYETVTNPPSPPHTPSGHCNALWDSDCDFSLDALNDWLDYLWDNIRYLSELITWAAKALKDLFLILSCTITAPFKATVSALLWIIQSSLHNILEELRHALALGSFVHPTSDWVKTSPIARECIEISGRSIKEIFNQNYARRAQKSNEGFLNYPKTKPEKIANVSGPYPGGSTPQAILSGWESNQGDAGETLYDLYSATTEPETLRELEFTSVGVLTCPALPLQKKYLVN